MCSRISLIRFGRCTGSRQVVLTHSSAPGVLAVCVCNAASRKQFSQRTGNPHHDGAEWIAIVQRGEECGSQRHDIDFAPPSWRLTHNNNGRGSLSLSVCVPSSTSKSAKSVGTLCSSAFRIILIQMGPAVVKGLVNRLG